MNLIGRHIGNHLVTRLLGEGGMGAVHEAQHQLLQRRVAIKVLHPHLSHDPQLVTRLMNEAQAVNIINHPGLITVFECGNLEDGAAYIIMEYLEGETLAQRIERSGGRLPPPSALHLGRQVASALSAAHRKQIIHCDLKPENIMIIADPEAVGGERTKLLDFGIAKLAAAGRAGSRTQTGAVLGTPLYMAPEQCRGRDITPKADVYAMGVMIYQMLAGRMPFAADDLLGLLQQHQSQEPCDLALLAPSLHPSLVAQVHAMLAKDPAQRPTMAEVEAWLRARCDAPPAPPLPTPMQARTSAQMSGQALSPAPVLPPGRARARLLWAALWGVGALALIAVSILHREPPAPRPTQGTPAPRDLGGTVAPPLLSLPTVDAGSDLAAAEVPVAPAVDLAAAVPTKAPPAHKGGRRGGRPASSSSFSDDRIPLPKFKDR